MDSNIAIITATVGPTATLLGAALGVLGTFMFGIRKSQQDRLTNSRMIQFESIRDAALAVETELRNFYQSIPESKSNGYGIAGIESNLHKIFLDYLTEVYFQCRRAELAIVDKEAGELLRKIEESTTAPDIARLAINGDVDMSKQLIRDYSAGILDQFRVLTKLSRDRALSLKKEMSWDTKPKPKYWSFEDERQRNKRRDGGLFT